MRYFLIQHYFSRLSSPLIGSRIPHVPVPLDQICPDSPDTDTDLYTLPFFHVSSARSSSPCRGPCRCHHHHHHHRRRRRPQGRQELRAESCRYCTSFLSNQFPTLSRPRVDDWKRFSKRRQSTDNIIVRQKRGQGRG